MLESVTETRAVVLFEDVEKLRFAFGISKTLAIADLRILWKRLSQQLK